MTNLHTYTITILVQSRERDYDTLNWHKILNLLPDEVAVGHADELNAYILTDKASRPYPPDLAHTICPDCEELNP